MRRSFQSCETQRCESGGMHEIAEWGYECGHRWLWKPKFREPPLLCAPISPHSRTDDMRMSLTIGDFLSLYPFLIKSHSPHHNLRATLAHNNHRRSVHSHAPDVSSRGGVHLSANSAAGNPMAP